MSHDADHRPKLVKERDEWKSIAECAEIERDEWKARAERAEAELKAKIDLQSVLAFESGQETELIRARRFAQHALRYRHLSRHDRALAKDLTSAAEMLRDERDVAQSLLDECQGLLVEARASNANFRRERDATLARIKKLEEAVANIPHGDTCGIDGNGCDCYRWKLTKVLEGG